MRSFFSNFPWDVFLILVGIFCLTHAIFGAQPSMVGKWLLMSFVELGMGVQLFIWWRTVKH